MSRVQLLFETSKCGCIRWRACKIAAPCVECQVLAPTPSMYCCFFAEEKFWLFGQPVDWMPPPAVDSCVDALMHNRWSINWQLRGSQGRGNCVVTVQERDLSLVRGTGWERGGGGVACITYETMIGEIVNAGCESSCIH